MKYAKAYINHSSLVVALSMGVLVYTTSCNRSSSRYGLDNRATAHQVDLFEQSTPLTSCKNPLHRFSAFMLSMNHSNSVHMIINCSKCNERIFFFFDACINFVFDSCCSAFEPSPKRSSSDDDQTPDFSKKIRFDHDDQTPDPSKKNDKRKSIYGSKQQKQEKKEQEKRRQKITIEEAIIELAINCKSIKVFKRIIGNFICKMSSERLCKCPAKSAICLSEVLLELLGLLNRQCSSELLPNCHSNDERNKLILTKIKCLLKKLLKNLSGKERLRPLINGHILDTVPFAEALLSAAAMNHAAILNMVLPLTYEIAGHEVHRKILCKPWKRSGSMLYRSVLRGGSESIGMIRCLADHLVYDPNALPHDGTSLPRLNQDIKSYFLDQLVGCTAGKKETALHLAAKNNNFDQVASLLALGANQNVEDSAGRTPLHLAVECADQAIIRLLLEHGATTDLKGNVGKLARLIDALLMRTLTCTQGNCYKNGAFHTKIVDCDNQLRTLLNSLYLVMDNGKRELFVYIQNLIKNIGQMKQLLGTNSNYRQIIEWLDLLRDTIVVHVIKTTVADTNIAAHTSLSGSSTISNSRITSPSIFDETTTSSWASRQTFDSGIMSPSTFDEITTGSWASAGTTDSGMTAGSGGKGQVLYCQSRQMEQAVEQYKY